MFFHRSLFCMCTESCSSFSQTFFCVFNPKNDSETIQKCYKIFLYCRNHFSFGSRLVWFFWLVEAKRNGFLRRLLAETLLNRNKPTERETTNEIYTVILEEFECFHSGNAFGLSYSYDDECMFSGCRCRSHFFCSSRFSQTKKNLKAPMGEGRRVKTRSFRREKPKRMNDTKSVLLLFSLFVFQVLFDKQETLLVGVVCGREVTNGLNFKGFL